MNLKIICLSLLFALAIGPMPGWTQDSHLEQPEHDQRSARRSRHKMEQEMKNVFWDQMKKLQHMENLCGEDEFFSLQVSSCESCDKYCDDLTSIEPCPEKCKVYYAKKKIEVLEEKNEKLSKTIQDLQKTEHKKLDLAPIWVVLGIAVFVLLILILAVTMAFWGKIRGMQHTIKEQNILIEANSKALEEKKIEDQEMIHQKKRIREATPDTTPNSTPGPSPSSTLSRETASTVAEEAQQDVADGITKAHIGIEIEGPGGK